MLSPDELRSAIATENLVQLCKVPGVGRKGAQRLVIELKDKINLTRLVSEPAVAGPDGSTTASAAGWREQVSQGLQGLGWSTRDAEAACDEVETLADGARDRGAAADAGRAAVAGPPMSDVRG